MSEQTFCQECGTAGGHTIQCSHNATARRAATTRGGAAMKNERAIRARASQLLASLQQPSRVPVLDQIMAAFEDVYGIALLDNMSDIHEMTEGDQFLAIDIATRIVNSCAGDRQRLATMIVAAMCLARDVERAMAKERK